MSDTTKRAARSIRGTLATILDCAQKCNDMASIIPEVKRHSAYIVGMVPDILIALLALETERDELSLNLFKRSEEYVSIEGKLSRCQTELTDCKRVLGCVLPHVKEMKDNGYEDTPKQVYYTTECQICFKVYRSIPNGPAGEVWKCTNPDCPAVQARKLLEAK